MTVVQWLRSRAHVVVPVAVVATALVTLVATLGHPPRIFFDETYYVNDARDMLEFGIETGFVVHPPLGKMLMALGIHLVGDTPFGWRIAGASLAVVATLLAYAIGRRLELHPLVAGLAAGALALDGVWIVQAHTGMLDSILAFFVVLGAWLLVRDRDHVRAADDEAVARARTRRIEPIGYAQPPPGEPADGTADAGAAMVVDPANGTGPTGNGLVATLPRTHRWWLVAAGAAFGAAVAVKWSGALALLAAVAVLVVSELLRRRRLLGATGARPMALVGLLVTLGTVAVVTYGLAWTPWFVAFDETWVADARCEPEGSVDCAGVDGRARALIRFHREMISFHTGLDADHSYRAPATGWPIMHRPVLYFYDSCSENRANRVPTTDDDGVESIPEPCAVEQGQYQAILSVGNPALWWGMLAVLPLFGVALRRRSTVAWIAAAFVAWQFVPWLAASRPVFHFYTVPLVPFLALAFAAAIDQACRRPHWWRPQLVGIGVAALVAGATWVQESLALPRLTWVATWYVAGVAAMVAGVVTARLADDAEPSADTGFVRRWPLAVAAVALVALAAWFLPLWWGITMEGPRDTTRLWLDSWL